MTRIARGLALAIAVTGVTGFAMTRVHAASDLAPGCFAIVSGAHVVEGAQGWSDAYPGTTWKRSYCLHLPAGSTTTAGMPLVVVLHGCTTWAPTAAYETHFNAVGDRHHFAVLYPQQSGSFSADGPTSHPYDGNGSYCWNWFLPDQLQRESPEPWLLHNLTENVISRYGLDRRRIYVIGISAGGAEANNLAVLYPELFSAVGVLAGCEYAGAPCLGSHSAAPPQASGYLAYQASEGHARPVPFLVENGDADPVVPVQNAYDDVLQWQTYDALAAGRSPSIAAPCAVTNWTPSPSSIQPTDPNDPLNTPDVPHAYTTLYYSADGTVCAPSARDFGQLIVVHGMWHQWPGGGPRREYTTEDGNWDIWGDPLGPDITNIAWQFFATHPCRLRRGVCVA
ncbi:MAG TPA: PHB depolymerase family esterase [Candidatus Dormibacteraeota bacterium]